MKYKIAVLLGALIFAGTILPQRAEALRIDIAIRDRPY
jgi:hypothetical protein